MAQYGTLAGPMGDPSEAAGSGGPVDDLSTATSDLQAEIDYYVTQRLYGHIQHRVEAELTSNYSLQYVYWRAFALIQQQQHSEGLALLQQLRAHEDYSLPAISLALQCPMAKAEQDQLRNDIRAASKSATITSLAIAARYFMYVNKLTKAKQCVEKALSRNKRHIGLIALYGLIQVRTAELLDAGDMQADIDDSTAESPDALLEKGLSTVKKSLKLSQLRMDLCALMTRVQALILQQKLDKALHDVSTTGRIHPQFIPAMEVKTQLLAATDKWQEAVTSAQDVLNKQQQVAATSKSVAVPSLPALRVLLQYSFMRSSGDADRYYQFRNVVIEYEPHSAELQAELSEFAQKLHIKDSSGDVNQSLSQINEVREEEEKSAAPTPANDPRTLYQQPPRKQSLVINSNSLQQPTQPRQILTPTGDSVAVNNTAQQVQRALIINSGQPSRPGTAQSQQQAPDVNDWLRQQRLTEEREANERAQREATERAQRLAEEQRMAEAKRAAEYQRQIELERQREEQRRADEQRHQERLARQQEQQRQQWASNVAREKERQVERHVDVDDIPTVEDIDAESSDGQEESDTYNPRQMQQQNQPEYYRRPAQQESASQRIARNKTLTADHFNVSPYEQQQQQQQQQNQYANNMNNYNQQQQQPYNSTPDGAPRLSRQNSQNGQPSPIPAGATSPQTQAEIERKQRIAFAAQQIEQAKQFVKSAYYGELFMKYGRRGSPHERTVTLEVVGRQITVDWGSAKLTCTKDQLKLVDGKQTAVFQSKAAKKAKPELCFSLVTAERTLDIEAKTLKTKEYWFHGMQLLLKYLK